MGVITFNGVSSDDLNVVVEYFPNYTVPEKVYQTVKIPGRNGDLIVDSGTYNNVVRTYDIAIADPKFIEDFSAMVNPVAEWLTSTNGYARLEDTYDDKYYRMAVCTNGYTVTNLLNAAGRCSIEFNCKPEKYLKSGTETIIVTENKSINNPTKFDSKPLIRVHGFGKGVLTINDIIIECEVEEYLDIDCYCMDCYKGQMNVWSEITEKKVEEIDLYGFDRLVKMKESQYKLEEKDEDTIYYVIDENLPTQPLDNMLIENSINLMMMRVGENQNGNVKMAGGFPVFKPGMNYISFNGDISKVEVVPRWWTI